MYVSIVTSQVNEFISKDKEEIKIYFYCNCDLNKTGCYFLLPYYLEYNGNILDYAQVRATLLCFFCVVYTPFILQSNITKIQRKKKDKWTPSPSDITALARSKEKSVSTN